MIFLPLVVSEVLDNIKDTELLPDIQISTANVTCNVSASNYNNYFQQNSRGH